MQVVVRNNKVASDEQVRTALDSALLVPLYQLSPHQLEDAVKELPVIKHAFVRRYCLPSPRLIVEVLEEFPWASYSLGPDAEPTYVIAESGSMIPIIPFPRITKPKLKIYGQQGLHLTSREVTQWATWIAYIEKQTQTQVQSIDLRNPQDVHLIAGDLFLKLGTADASLS